MRVEIFGASDQEVDRITWVDDLSVKTLLGLMERLRQTTHGEQFLFREAELDDTYRQADAELQLARRAGADPELLRHLECIREMVFRAHDYVGEGDMVRAMKELSGVIDIKIGIDGR
jgi:hypothetical protein